MPRLYQTKIWQLHLPETWKASDHCGEGFVTFFRADGVGMLIVLTADESETAADSGTVFRGLLPGSTREFKSDTSYCRSWTFVYKGRKVSVWYSCAAQNADAELSEVEEIVKSISERDDAGR